ncbi:hypothetical protein C8R47DRAFT_984613 [Mycena vitilis]|nr:hypothetical protein C8R47DRAFT_984613 [Mycena vitilis]
MSEFVNQQFEAIWIDNMVFLEQKGYMIHPKYNVASFHPTPDSLEWQEAFHGGAATFDLAEAVRESDGARVMLKALKRDCHEVQIARFFSDSSRSSNPRNHCVPLYDVLEPPLYPRRQIMVMPLLREFRDPPFDTVGEVIECFRQLIEGVQFMHEHQVAHRDLSVANYMMDGREMYPGGFHAGVQGMTRDFSGYVRPSATRTMCWPRYFLIDFEYARRYPTTDIPAEGKKSRRDHTAAAPGAEGVGCNPFPTDIYWIGTMLRSYFLDSGRDCVPKCVGLEFLRPLVNDMLKKQPSERPTIDEVAIRYHELVKHMTKRHLRSVCQVERDSEVFWRIGYLTRRIKFMFTRRSPLPPTAPPTAVLPESLRAFFTQERLNVKRN